MPAAGVEKPRPDLVARSATKNPQTVSSRIVGLIGLAHAGDAAWVPLLSVRLRAFSKQYSRAAALVSPSPTPTHCPTPSKTGFRGLANSVRVVRISRSPTPTHPLPHPIEKWISWSRRLGEGGSDFSVAWGWNSCSGRLGFRDRFRARQARPKSVSPGAPI